ncbi:MAG TPA: DinB family protein [Gemmatimonadales bacterium]|nr:DinB family protein [Gemmatimonadales bacterium]
MTGPRLTPRLAALVDRLTEARAELLAVAASIAPGEGGRRPAADAWSVGEILEHLRIVESGVVRAWSRLVARCDLAALGPETATDPEASPLDEHRLDQRLGRIAAPERVRPAPGADASAALAGLAQSRRELLALIERVNGVALGTLTLPHPFLGPLSLYDWLVFIAQHERRHAAQADKTIDALRRAASAAPQP